MIKLVAQQNPAPADPIAYWVLIGFGALLLFYLWIRPRLNKKKDPLADTPRLSLAQQRAVERDMNRLLVDMAEMARQITAQLDTRSQKLELLIKEADDKLASLRQATGSPQPAPPPMRLVQAPPPDPEPDPRHAAVYALADEGRSPHEISQQLDRPKGEVELILALRPRR